MQSGKTITITLPKGRIISPFLRHKAHIVAAIFSFPEKPDHHGRYRQLQARREEVVR